MGLAMFPKEDDCVVCGSIPPLDRPLFRVDLFQIPLESDRICKACTIAFWRNLGLPVVDDEGDETEH